MTKKCEMTFCQRFWLGSEYHQDGFWVVFIILEILKYRTEIILNSHECKFMFIKDFIDILNRSRTIDDNYGWKTPKTYVANIIKIHFFEIIF